MKVNFAAIFCALTIAKLRKHFVLFLSFFFNDASGLFARSFFET